MNAASPEPINWNTLQRCLLLGACGSGMKAIARILNQAGHTLSGADLAFDPLQNPLPDGVTRIDWDRRGSESRVDVCIASQAVPKNAPQLSFFRRSGIPCLTLHAALDSLLADTRQVCVAGTHGKSTTSALLAWILRQCGRDPSWFVGADFCSDIASGNFGRDPVSVIESCEFSRSFHQLTPHDVILTGIDGDHFDCFPHAADEQQAFREFVAALPRDGLLLWPKYCHRSSEVARESPGRSRSWSFGRESTATWNGRFLDVRPDCSVVRVDCGNHHFADLEVPLSGDHNGANVVAGVAMASHLGITALECVKTLKAFPGLRRRLEHRRSERGLILLDDYAHHPTAVTTTLLAVRQRYPRHRICVLFEPHQVLRMTRLLHEFSESLCLASETVVLPAFPARETISADGCRRISRRLAVTIRESGGQATVVDSPEEAVLYIEQTGQPGDVFLTMGAGQVSRIHDNVHRRFQRHPAA